MRFIAYLESSILTVLLAILTLLTKFSLAVLSDATCYSPDGVNTPGNFPCFLGQDASACCGEGVLCLSTGLCEPAGSTGASDFIRGTCTDSTWKSSSCPQYCLGSNTGGTNLISCQNVTNNDQDFCCDHTDGCCDSGIGRFRIGAEATIVATIGPGGVPVTIQQSTIFSSSSSTQASSSTASSTPLSAVSSTTSSTTSLSASPLTSPTTIAPVPLGPTNNATNIGIGVGVGVGACILLVAGFLLFRYRRKIGLARRRLYQSAPSMEQNNMEAHNGLGHQNPGYDSYEPIKTFGIGHTRSELDGVPRAELDSLSRPAEMHS